MAPYVEAKERVQLIYRPIVLKAHSEWFTVFCYAGYMFHTPPASWVLNLPASERCKVESTSCQLPEPIWCQFLFAPPGLPCMEARKLDCYLLGMFKLWISCGTRRLTLMTFGVCSSSKGLRLFFLLKISQPHQPFPVLVPPVSDLGGGVCENPTAPRTTKVVRLP